MREDIKEKKEPNDRHCLRKKKLVVVELALNNLTRFLIMVGMMNEVKGMRMKRWMMRVMMSS